MAKQKKISKAARTYLTSFILVGGFWGAIEAVKLSGGLSSKAADRKSTRLNSSHT